MNCRDFAEPGRLGFAEMRAQCGHPELLVEKGLVDGIVPMEQLRQAMAESASHVTLDWESFFRRPVIGG